MNTLRLLIVDDVEVNRLTLASVCRKLEGFEIREACDGLDAIAVAEAWHPHIILMDVLMPNLDGIEASKRIKSRFPDTIIIVLTAVIDPQMEENISSIGVAAYVHKPIDPDLIRYKLRSFAALLRSKEGDYAKLSAKEALNPFSGDVRHFKTIFDIRDPEGMMDFGIWILSRCEDAGCGKVDPMIELFYELMRRGVREAEPLSIIIEESFEEIFVTMKFDREIILSSRATELVADLEEHCIIRHNIVCVRLEIAALPAAAKPVAASSPAPLEKPVVPVVSVVEQVVETFIEEVVETTVEKEVRIVETQEKVLLRQSFTEKTSAIEYVRDIGGDVLDEIRDLESLDAEWIEKLHILESDPGIDKLRDFADGVLGVYVRAINNLFEFTALAYALSSLGAFLKENAPSIMADPKKLKTLVMLLEHLGEDLSSWREHIFSLQDTADIHYLDSSFFSSCMQIEGIITDKEVATDDDNDFEFF